MKMQILRSRMNQEELRISSLKYIRSKQNKKRMLNRKKKEKEHVGNMNHHENTKGA